MGMLNEQGGLNERQKRHRSTWAIGGGLILGLGVGFFFLGDPALAFVGSMLSGLGLGLMVTSILSSIRKHE